MTRTCDICGKLYEKCKNNKSTHCKSCLNSKYSKAAKATAVNYKGDCCQVCGYDRCLAALEFHHVNPDSKEIDLVVSNLASYSIAKLNVELRKCILLCANCHREYHAALDAVFLGYSALPIIEEVNKKHKEWLEKTPDLKQRLPWKEHHPRFVRPDINKKYLNSNTYEPFTFCG